jgi:arylsulfatase A-like enzyme
MRRVAGLFAGASLAGLLAANFGNASLPYFALVMPITAGAWLVAAGVALLLLPASASTRLGPRLGGAGVWLAAGLGLGLMPVPGALGLSSPWNFVLGAGLAAALVAAALRLRLCVPARACAVFALLTPAWTLPCAFYHNFWLFTRLLRDAEAQIELPAVHEPADRRAVSAPSGAPDVFLVSVDTLRADAVVGARLAEYRTPFLDALRTSGTWWPYGLSSSNQTLPGHAGMLLGRDAMGTTVRWNYDEMPSADWGLMLAERFHAAGFRTAGVISNDLLSREYGFGRGFELYDDTTVPRQSVMYRAIAWHERNSWLGILLDQRIVARFFQASQYVATRISPRGLGSSGQLARGRVTNEQAFDALDQLYAQDRPFFFFLHYMDPHQPYGAPAPYAGRLTAGLPPLPPRYAPSRRGMFALPEIELAGSDLRSDDPQLRADAALAMQWMHRTYLEKVMFLDAQLEQVHARATASGRPFVWLLTSDHGEHFGEHGVVLHGGSLFEPEIRVPFILAGQGVAPSGEATGVPRLEDVAPTLLALAGVAPPDDLHGRALSLQGAAGPEVPHVAVDQSRAAWRVGGWKAHGRWRGLSEVDGRSLFRLEVDPGEVQELPFDQSSAELLQALADFLHRDLYPSALKSRAQRMSPGMQDDLAELGYGAGVLEQHE